MCLKKARRNSYKTFALLGYDDDVPSKLFADWITIKKFKAKTLSQAKRMGQKFAKKSKMKIWKVRKER
jgi:hypothetical protein